MICPGCQELLPHDLVHVREHAALCSGSVEIFLGRFVRLCESIERMARDDPAGNSEPMTGRTRVALSAPWIPWKRDNRPFTPPGKCGNPAAHNNPN